MSQTTDTQTSKPRAQPSPAGKGQAGSSELARQQSPDAGTHRDDLPTFLPATDIYDAGQSILMFLDVPGADPDGLDITLEKRVLSVFARSKPFEPDGYTPLYAEFQPGNYRRAFTLSDEVDREKIEAALKDGVLRLTLPKTTPPPAKKIQVKAD